MFIDFMHLNNKLLMKKNHASSYIAYHTYAQYIEHKYKVNNVRG